MWFTVFIILLSLSLCVNHYIKRKRKKNKITEHKLPEQPFIKLPPVHKEYDCPHCKTPLINPGRKRKRICPHCSNEYIHIYFTERNLKKVFNLEEGKILLKEEEAKRRKERNRRWPILNQQLSIYAGNNEWMKYSFCHWEMAEILHAEGKHTESLRHLLSKCYLDLNGPSDIHTQNTEDSLLAEAKPFDPKQAYIPPATIRLTIDQIEILKLKKEDVRKMFFEKVYEKNFNLPCSIPNCWKYLQIELF